MCNWHVLPKSQVSSDFTRLRAHRYLHTKPSRRRLHRHRLAVLQLKARMQVHKTFGSKSSGQARDTAQQCNAFYMIMTMLLQSAVQRRLFVIFVIVLYLSTVPCINSIIYCFFLFPCCTHHSLKYGSTPVLSLFQLLLSISLISLSSLN